MYHDRPPLNRHMATAVKRAFGDLSASGRILINELRRIFEDRPFDTTDVWLREHHDAELAAAIDAEIPGGRYKHGGLKQWALRKALQGLVGTGLVETETGHWRCMGGTGQ
jgi:hypothetical protein